jgi:hypothetical protein
LVLRVVAGIMFLVFLLAIIVQYNDPDPAVWMLLYAVPAALSLLAMFKLTHWLALLPAAVYFLLCALWGPDWRNVDSSIWRPHLEMMGDDIERAREVIGLLIAAVWMVTLGIIGLRGRRGSNNASPASPDQASPA